MTAAAPDSPDHPPAEQSLIRNDSPAAPPIWFDAVSDVIVITDAHNHIEQWNRAAEQIYGWLRDEVIGRPIMDILAVVRYMGEGSSADVWHALATAGTWRGEFVQRTRDGREVVMDGSVQALYDDHGTITGYITINRNITARVQAEAALVASETRSATLFATMAQGVVYQAADGQIITCNPAAERILGLTLEQMQGHTSIDPRWRAIHEDGSPFSGETHPSMVALHSGQIVGNVVMGVYHWDEDAYRWISITAVPKIPTGQTAPIEVYTTFDDITEKFLAEAAARDHAQALDQAQVLVLDLESRILVWTSGAEQLYGYTKAEALGQVAHALLQTIFPEPLTQITATLTDTGRWSGTLTHRTHAGQTISVASQWLLDRDATGQPRRVIEANTDISEQIRATARLQVLSDASQAFATAGMNEQAVLHQIAAFLAKQLSSGCVIRLLDPTEQWLDAVAIAANDPAVQAELQAVFAAERIPIDSPNPTAMVFRTRSGVLLAPLDLKHVRRLIPPPVWDVLAHSPLHSAMIVPLATHHRPFGILSIACADATRPILTDDDLRLAQDLADRAALALANARLFGQLQAELTARIHVQAALYASEATLRIVTDAAGVGLALVDIDYRYRYTNQTHRDFVDRPDEELAEQRVVDVLGPTYAALVQQRLERAFAGELVSATIDLPLANGRGMRHCEVQIKCTHYHNKPVAIVVLIDITERVHAEEALVAEHQRVVQLKNEFMATMSHELRTPLNVILGYSNLLLELLYGPLTERQTTSIETLQRSGNELLALINDILDYTKFESGQIALDWAEVNIAQVCRESMQPFLPLAQQKQILLTIVLDPTVDTLRADARRLQQILSNLLSNALKFTPDGGKVELHVGHAPNQGIITFSVIDTGIGIAEVDIPRLFQPFTQLDSKLSRRYEGSGLGLALVRRLAEAHGGTVHGSSTLGQGSRFRVILPQTMLRSE